MDDQKVAWVWRTAHTLAAPHGHGWTRTREHERDLALLYTGAGQLERVARQVAADPAFSPDQAYAARNAARAAACDADRALVARDLEDPPEEGGPLMVPRSADEAWAMYMFEEGKNPSPIAGLAPRLSHTTATGRVTWVIDPEELTVAIQIWRPDPLKERDGIQVLSAVLAANERGGWRLVDRTRYSALRGDTLVGAEWRHCMLLRDFLALLGQPPSRLETDMELAEYWLRANKAGVGIPGCAWCHDNAWYVRAGDGDWRVLGRDAMWAIGHILRRGDVSSPEDHLVDQVPVDEIIQAAPPE